MLLHSLELPIPQMLGRWGVSWEKLGSPPPLTSLMHPGLFLPPWEQGTVPPLMFLIREYDTYIRLKERRKKHFCLWCTFSPEVADSFHTTLAQGDLIYRPSDEIFFVSLLSTRLLLKETLAAVKKMDRQSPGQPWTMLPGCVVSRGAAGASSRPHLPLSVSFCFTPCEQGDQSSESQGIRQNSSPSAGGHDEVGSGRPGRLEWIFPAGRSCDSVPPQG